MARRRYYRRYVRVAPKKKWASNIIQGSVSTTNYATIVENSAQTATPTPVIVKCGNFKVQGDAQYAYPGGSSRPVNLNFFLIFVPEGVTPSDGLIGSHPEWVIGWRNIDVVGVKPNTESGVAAAAFSFSSRLKRNLNSGDRVCAIIQTNDSQVSASSVFTCQYWTCAN